LFSFLFLFCRRRRSAANDGNLPPSPWKLPIIGNLHQVGPLAHRSLQSLSRRCGPVMLLRFGSFPVVVVSSAEAAGEVLKNQDLKFADRPKLGMARRLMYGCRDIAFSAYGEYWRRIRSICVVHLLSNKKVQSFRRVREEETSNMVERIKQNGSSSPVNLSEMIYEVTNDVITRVSLGKQYEKEDEEGTRFRKLLTRVSVMFGAIDVEDVVPWLGWINRINGLNTEAEKIASEVDEFLGDLIRESREKDKRNCSEEEMSNFVDILLDFQREHEDESPVEDDTIKAIILDMFVAGTDTTSNALIWAVAELLKNPAAMEALQREVRNAVDDKGSELAITEEDVNKMPYLKAVVRETLRLHPPAPLLLPHESTQRTTVMGYEIPSRVRVMINAWAIMNDPTVWVDPQDFKPERFLLIQQNIDFNEQLQFKYIPFGSGRRGCPGTNFATAVVELVVAKLVYHFDFSLPEVELDMSEAPGITLRKKVPL
ncbi:hypothetical protein M569_08137, partial [Genlisea aurea]